MQLDPSDNNSIRAEVGERLRHLFSRYDEDIPPRLRDLLRQIEAAEGASSPSCVVGPL
jgi:hypothetical protein